MVEVGANKGKKYLLGLKDSMFVRNYAYIVITFYITSFFWILWPLYVKSYSKSWEQILLSRQDMKMRYTKNKLLKGRIPTAYKQTLKSYIVNTDK